METSLKTGFAQIFSCCPKNLSRPKFGGAAAPLAPSARTPMVLLTYTCKECTSIFEDNFNKWTHCYHAAFAPRSFFFYENIFYKNIEAEIREILRIF